MSDSVSKYFEKRGTNNCRVGRSYPQLVLRQPNISNKQIISKTKVL